MSLPGETMYDGDEYQLQRLPDANEETYALRAHGLYVEFSSVELLDMTWLLGSDSGGAYMSVRHSTGEEGDVPDALYEELAGIYNGD